MTLDPSDAATLTLAEAAELLSSSQGARGQQLRRAVDAQLVRRRVRPSDRDDVRAEVAFALLASPRAEQLSMDAACAHAARVARNKAVDLHRRSRREAPDAMVAERAVEATDASLDTVEGEVHRRDVSRALVELVRELPPSERLALTATATGTGFAGSGLGRSSHYRALDRARLRLSVAVRARVAGGLALPLILLRSLEPLRALILPAGVTAAAAIAGIAFVLPTITPPTEAYARAKVTQRLARTSTLVAPRAETATASPAHVVRVRARVPAVRATRLVVPRSAAPRVTRPVVERSAPTPAAGLDPCRAAQLCQ